MGKDIITFESICADYSGKQSVIFEISSDYEENYDCVDTCIVWNDIVFYGVPLGLSDDQCDNIMNGEYKDAVRIGKLKGCLILCKQIIDGGNDPLEVCDDSDADLEYTISALQDEGGPLNSESGDPEQNVYYIHELQMESGFDYGSLKSRIIKELPGLIFSLLHVAPDILAFYPEPLDFTPDPSEAERLQILQSIVADKVDSAIGSIAGKRKDTNEEENISKLADAYQFSDDELKFAMRRRSSSSSYPEQAKDQKEYAFYEANDFEEVGNSRLLYKHVGRGN
jgi:hypothetical protein